jgi:hypothetical protein
MITQERLRELVRYCPETGIFTHLESNRRKKAGMQAGSLRRDGYVYIMIGGHRALAHRFAWLYMTGEWPVADIDHIDGNKSNNSFNNLRDVSRSVNVQNQNRAKRTSKTGYLGVRYHGPNKFVAAISLNGKSTYLGVFSDALNAHNAYLKAKREMHEGCVI